MTYTAKTATTFTIGAIQQGHTSSFTASEAKLQGALTATSPANGGSMTIDNLTNAEFPKQGTLLVGTEHITYTGWTANVTTRPLNAATSNTLTLTGITRAANGTTAASAADVPVSTAAALVAATAAAETQGLAAAAR